MNQGEIVLFPEDAALLLQMLQPRCEYDPATCYRLFDRLEACAKLVIPNMGKDKVWYGLTTNFVRLNAGHNQADTIVRASSKAEAVRLLNAAAGHPMMTMHQFSGWWSETGNREQLAQATEKGVWVKGSEGWVKA
jgi:hypothetical protein